jgi:hypothetical protein
MDNTQDNPLLHPMNPRIPNLISRPPALAEDEPMPASFWELYNQRAEAYDNEKIKGSTETLNVLILFVRAPDVSALVFVLTVSRQHCSPPF